MWLPNRFFSSFISFGYPPLKRCHYRMSPKFSTQVINIQTHLISNGALGLSSSLEYEYNNIRIYKIFGVLARGTLHPLPLKNNTILGVLVFNQFHASILSSFPVLVLLIVISRDLSVIFSSRYHSRPTISCNKFGSSPNFLQYIMYKIVIQLNHKPQILFSL